MKPKTFKTERAFQKEAVNYLERIRVYCPHEECPRPPMFQGDPWSGQNLKQDAVKRIAAAKAQGWKKSHPDLTIYEPRHGYHGLCIELKNGPKAFGKKTPILKANELQAIYLAKMNARGYLGAFIETWEEFTGLVDWYMGDISYRDLPYLPRRLQQVTFSYNDYLTIRRGYVYRWIQ